MNKAKKINTSDTAKHTRLIITLDTGLHLKVQSTLDPNKNWHKNAGICVKQ